MTFNQKIDRSNLHATMKLSIVFLTACLLAAAYALDETKYHEIECEDFNPKVDMKWMSSVKTWYGPMWSQLDRIRTASIMLNKPMSELKEKEIPKKACGIYKIDGKFFAFENVKKFGMEVIENGFKFDADGHTGEYQFELTDNKSFILGSTCWDDGQVTWGLTTTSPNISPELEKKIRMHVESLGFNPKMIYKENYDGCDFKGKVEL